MLNYSTLTGGGLEVVTGGDPVKLDFDADLLRVSVSDATFALGEFIYVRGGFALELRDAIEVTDLAGATKEVSLVTFGISNAYVFAGVGGPYWVDSNGDGKITSADTPNSTGAIGVAVGGVTTALAILSNRAAANIAYVGLKVTADSAAMVGLGDGQLAAARQGGCKGQGEEGAHALIVVGGGWFVCSWGASVVSQE